MVVCTHDQFYVDSYVVHFNNGNLRKGVVIYCHTKKDMERVRPRVLRYAQFRNHILQTSKLDEKNLLIKVTGILHLDK